MAQTLRLAVFLLCAFNFILTFGIVVFLGGLNLNSLLISLVPTAFVWLLSYWLYMDGVKIDRLTQHLGIDGTVIETDEIINRSRKEEVKQLPRCCGNCKSYLRDECPAGYEKDAEVWRMQNVCDEYIQKNK